MDNITLLKVPITERERRESYEDYQRLLTEDASQHNAREINSSIGRFKSLRGFPRVERQAYVSIPDESADTSQEPIEVHDIDRNAKSSPKITHLPPHLSRKLWTPIWLRKSTLGLFAVLFLGLIVALLVLRYMSLRSNGFYVSEVISHYTWTYGPTAVLVVIISLWRQVDYHCKILTPWAELRKGPISASKSLLVDYISPFQFVAFFEAVKNGHTSVIISITGFALLKIITVFSTGLLILLPTTLNSPSIPSSSTSKFDASKFVGKSTLPYLPTRPIYSRLGNLKYGLPFPDGITKDFAYIPVVISNEDRERSTNATYSVVTEALVPDFGCEIMGFNLTGPSTIHKHRNLTDIEHYTVVDISYTLPNGVICDRWPATSIQAINTQWAIDPPARQFVGNGTPINCLDIQGRLVGDPVRGEVRLFALAYMEYSQTVLSNGTIDNSTITVANMSVVACKPKLSTATALITNNTAISGDAGLTVSIVSDQSDLTMFPGLTAGNLSSAYDLDFWTSTALTYVSGWGLMALSYGTLDLEPLLDAKKLKASAEATFSGIMSYYALEVMTAPAQVKRTADLMWSSDRLHINSTSLWVMVTGFGILFLSCILLLFISPRAVVARDPSSIAANATVLARSAELNQLIQKQSVPNEKNLRLTLQGQQFQETIASTEQGIESFKVMVSRHTTSQGTPVEMPLKWYIPFTATVSMFALTITVPLAVIVVLEFLQRKSDANQGFIAIHRGQITDLYMRYIPTSVLLLVATLINTLDFNIAIFSPWSTLAKGNAIGRRSVLSNITGKWPPIALFEALRLRFWGAASSSIAATLASVFTIIVSGLYTVNDFRYPGPVQELLRTDSFKLQNNYSMSDDNSAAIINNLVIGLDLAYPLGTYDELVLPRYSLGQLKEDYDVHSSIVGPFTVVVPALRANLQCDILPQTNTNFSHQIVDSWNQEEWFSSSNYTPPAHCVKSSGKVTVVEWEWVYSLNKNITEPTGYGGHLTDIIFGTNDSRGWRVDEGSNTDDNSPPDGCPSLIFTYGAFSPRIETPDSFTTFVCYQQIQQLDVSVTFQTNSTDLDLNYPPITNESSVIALTNPNSSNGSTVFNFRIERNLEMAPTIGSFLHGGDAGEAALLQQAGLSVDGFFATIINGTEKIDPSSLAGPSNEDNLYNAINHLYRRYMAQVINSNMRDPPPGFISGDEKALRLRQNIGSVAELHTTISTPRLVQNETSKIILQILIGISTALALTAYILTPIRRVLPINPCSIGGMMALLAGSDLCYNPEENACGCCGKRRHHSFPISEQTQHNIDSVDHDDYAHSQNITMQIIDDGAEFMNDHSFSHVFSSGKRYSMGWWKEDKVRHRKRRFGVDIGSHPDGNDNSHYDMQEQKTQGQG